MMMIIIISHHIYYPLSLIKTANFIKILQANEPNECRYTRFTSFVHVIQRMQILIIKEFVIKIVQAPLL